MNQGQKCKLFFLLLLTGMTTLFSITILSEFLDFIKFVLIMKLR